MGISLEATGFVSETLMSALVSWQPSDPAQVGPNGADALLRIPRRAHALAEFRRWALSDDVPDKLPLAFLDGEVIVDMSKEEIRSHALVKTECGRSLANVILEINFGHLFINGVLVSNVAANVSNNPDLVAVSFRSLKRGTVRYIEHNGRILEIEGSPDLAVEIVSNSSVVKDTRDLRDLYHRARIREYWLIDARGETIEFQILQWRKSGYSAAPAQSDWQKSRVLGRGFRLTRTRDRAGIWKYELQARAA
jgi:Uma2 family endonuclease